jgi:hypothetical protein
MVWGVDGEWGWMQTQAERRKDRGRRWVLVDELLLACDVWRRLIPSLTLRYVLFTYLCPIYVLLHNMNVLSKSHTICLQRSMIPSKSWTTAFKDILAQ